MPICPDGHDSTDPDFCDICGIRIGGAPASGSAASGSAASGSAASGAGPAPAPASAAPGGAAEPCPQCGAARSGQFCETCGYDFVTGKAMSPAVPPAPAKPDSGPTPAPGGGAAGQGGDGDAGQAGAGTGPAGVSVGTGPAGVSVGTGPAGVSVGTGPAGVSVGTGPARVSVGTGPAGVSARPGGDGAPGAAAAAWTAVVTADRAYYESVISEGGPDAGSIEFPGYCPERRFRLSGQEMRIGRRSVSRGLEPEIDLTGPPADPGVSHLHAVLIAQADGSWVVLDPGSANGTVVNGGEIPGGVQVPLHDGDRVCVGAFTVLTIRAPGST
jgi:hypothetical protein